MKITLFDTSFDKVINRYYLMMAVIIGSFYLGTPIIALLALPIFLSAILGMDFKLNKKNQANIHYPNIEASDLGRMAA